jgi:tRNA nucleotidyltransferase (CCA-adding enzyme)
VSSFAPLDIPVPILQIARTLEGAGFEAWCVGGSLRDTLLGHPHSDYDIATSATPEQVQRLFARTIAVGIKYGTVGVLDEHRTLHEVTTFRRDVATDGRHAVVQYGVSLEDDLARRDFTINAIAYHPLRHEWRDPFAGTRDLQAGLVRCVGVPGERFREDFLRILRGLRFAARFGFQIEPATWNAAQAAAPGLAQLSAERVRDEWFKGLQTTTSVTRLVSLWIDVGAARVWLPELETGALQADTVPEPPAGARDPVLLTALAVETPSTVLSRLRASNAQIDRAAAIESNPAEPAGSDAASVRRWLSLVGAAADDLTDLWELRQGGAAPWADLMATVRARKDPLTRSDLAITGTDLLALGINGPRIGMTLTALLDRVLEEPSLNSRDALLALARELS